jgi:hypothetical protein
MRAIEIIRTTLMRWDDLKNFPINIRFMRSNKFRSDVCGNRLDVELKKIDVPEHPMVDPLKNIIRTGRLGGDHPVGVIDQTATKPLNRGDRAFDRKMKDN